MKVIDNFLSSYEFKCLQQHVFDREFIWHFNDGINKSPDPYWFQFYHRLTQDDGTTCSPSMDKCMPLIDTLDPEKLLKLKINLTSRTVFRRFTGYHIDNVPGAKKTAIFYLNTNNGYTKFRSCKVKSVANRIVIFDSNLEHAGVTCTDEKRRVVININYV